MHQEVLKYHQSLPEKEQAICNLLFETICKYLPEATYKVWHAHPVWFLDGNPIVGYSLLKSGIRLMFWSGQSFDEEILKPSGSFKAADLHFSEVEQIKTKDLKRCLTKAKNIQWDYKNIVKRKGELLPLIGIEEKIKPTKPSPYGTLKFKTIDEYHASLSQDIQKQLTVLRNAIKQAAPESEETISYNMPAFKLGKVLVYYAANKEHIGFYPTPSPISDFKEELSCYKTTKGAIQFPMGEPLPLELIKKIVKHRLNQELEAMRLKSSKK
jgi:uncharacterized protein YdhG (YjbR/CyaY superfamily)